jgi:predicted RNA-binding protein with RPS1 domain
MGSNSSREKRKLKRLQAVSDQAQQTAAAAAPSVAETPKSSVKKNTSKPSAKKRDPSTTASGNSNAYPNQTSSSNAVMRLKRKLERKASGKFKLASLDKPLSDKKNGQPTSHKRKPEREDSGSKRPKTNGGSQNSNPKSPMVKKTPMKRSLITKKSKVADGANKKPKHLNRKLAQLSKSLADGGGSIAELELQMNQIKEQIELIKSMKSGGAKVVEDYGDKGPGPANTGASPASSDSDEGTSSESKDNLPMEKVPKQAPAKSHAKDDSSSSSSDDDDSSDEEIVEENTRSRGKRRRGRREKTEIVEKNDEGANDEPEMTGGEETKGGTDGENPSKKKTSKKDDTRHCIGRKPVTDFSIGQKLPGTVKYIKSTLGAFIDVGSHSDAFCHISCISDGYAETVEEVVNIGDQVIVRVVEVDREKKRLTVSLRSDEMAKTEQQKLQAKQKKKSEHKSGFGSMDKKAGHTRFVNKSEQGSAEEKNLANSNPKRNSTGDVKIKTGADLKRERKLARRAERRENALAAG